MNAADLVTAVSVLGNEIRAAHQHVAELEAENAALKAQLVEAAEREGRPDRAAQEGR